MRWLFLLILILSGCSKVAVFEPKEVEKRLNYDQKIGSEVMRSTTKGASLANGKLLTNDQDETNISSSSVFLSQNGGWVVSVENQTDLIITAPSGKETTIDSNENILTASSDGQIVAITTQNNGHKVVDLESGQTLFFTQEKLAITANAKSAEPYIDQNSIVFATLDGKLIFVDRASWQKQRELVVGYEEFFNNPIYLGFHEGSFISATASRIVALDQLGNVHSIEKEIKQVIALESGLYLFALNGEIIRLSGRLESLASTKVPFARVVAGVEKDNNIYLVEHSGWIIKLTSDLASYKVYELPDIASMPLFASKKQLYYGRKIVFWP